MDTGQTLKRVEGRAIIQIDLEGKNWHTFSNGQKIRLERQFNELNRRITEPVNAIVIDGLNMKTGCEILIHPNGVNESNKINNYKNISGEETGSSIKYYSIPEEQCFIWKDENGTWQPLPPYETALRVFIPYSGFLVGIEPSQIKDALYVTSGELKEKVVMTLKSCDYEIIFQDTNGRESRIIRFRPFGDKKTDREEEAIAILDEATDKVKKGEYLVGLSTSDAKTLNELANVH